MLQLFSQCRIWVHLIRIRSKRKLENGEQRPAPETFPARAEIPKITDQRLGRASLTRGNVAGSHIREIIPSRVVLPFILPMRSTPPQCGQVGPFGHMRDSTKANAATSSWKCFAERMDGIMTLAEQIKALEIAQFQGTQFHCLLRLARSEGRF